MKRLRRRWPIYWGRAIQATALAPGVLYQELLRQSNMLGYLNSFRFVAWVCFVSLGLLFFLKRTQDPKGSVPVH